VPREGGQEGGCVRSREEQPEEAAQAVRGNAKRGADTDRANRWSWVEASIWSERMLAALENGVRGGKWFSLIDKVYAPRTLQLAWQRVWANRGAAGVDRVSIERFSRKATEYLEELATSLREGTYRPQAVRRVHIPKGSGRTRPLGIPVVKDRIVQTALKLVLEPIFEKEFHPYSFGFRPGRGCKDALREVDRLLKEGYTFVVDADLASYFDTIPHIPLMDLVKEKISDRRVLQLVEDFLSQDILEAMKTWTPTAGTPQGAVVSPLLANIYLHPLDKTMGAAGHQMIRYADDFVVLCRSRREAEAALEYVRQWVEENGLRLHPEKTHVGDCRIEGEGFEFLGYRFEAGQRRVRPKSMKALRDKIRQKTRRSNGRSVKMVIADLNPVLRGWFAYFQHAHKYTFPIMDGFVRRRLRSIRRKQSRNRGGTGRSLNDHLRWPNTFFAELGLFTMTEAHAQARRSR
jgi:RNA-directed DNA polymerase